MHIPEYSVKRQWLAAGKEVMTARVGRCLHFEKNRDWAEDPHLSVCKCALLLDKMV